MYYIYSRCKYSSRTWILRFSMYNAKKRTIISFVNFLEYIRWVFITRYTNNSKRCERINVFYHRLRLAACRRCSRLGAKACTWCWIRFKLFAFLASDSFHILYNNHCYYCLLLLGRIFFLSGGHNDYIVFSKKKQYNSTLVKICDCTLEKFIRILSAVRYIFWGLGSENTDIFRFTPLHLL